MTARRPTIHDVARAAGVSKSTVSLVLQDKGSVRDETRALVRLVMARIGYVYNRGAANLRGAKGWLIGLIISDLRKPYFNEFAASVQMELADHGFAAVFANSDDDPKRQAEAAALMIEHGVSGLIISPAKAAEAGFDLLAQAGIAVLQVIRKGPGPARFPFAAPDSVRGGRLQALHLMSRGARRVVYAGGLAGRLASEERMAGYLEVQAKLGLEPRFFAG